MDKNLIREEAKNIYRSDKKNLLIAGGIYAVMSFLTMNMASGFTGTLFATIINGFVMASSVCFYFFAFQNRKSDFKDMYEIFTNASRLNNTLAIIIFLCLVDLIFFLADTFLSFIPFLSIFVMIAEIAVKYSLILVWYLYVANPDYSLKYYIKASSKFISIDYIWFAVSVLILPVAASLMLSMILPASLASFICYPLMIYANLAVAGFADTLIPDVWYDGNYKI